MAPATLQEYAVDEEVVEAAEGELNAALDLAFTRTELASDRTLLAWIRTALTLMAPVAYDKGFACCTIKRCSGNPRGYTVPILTGCCVTGTSARLLAIATIRHVMIARSLASTRSRGMGGAIPSLLAAALVILLGCAVVVFLLATG